MALAVSEQLIEIGEISTCLKKSFHCPGIYAGNLRLCFPAINDRSIARAWLSVFFLLMIFCLAAKAEEQWNFHKLYKNELLYGFSHLRTAD